jgi:hypothetical protein
MVALRSSICLCSKKVDGVASLDLHASGETGGLREDAGGPDFIAIGMVRVAVGITDEAGERDGNIDPVFEGDSRFCHERLQKWSREQARRPAGTQKA